MGLFICRAFYLIGDKAVGRKVYCLGSGIDRYLYDYIYDLKRIVNNKADVGIGELEYSEETPMHMCADITLIKNDTGWSPETSFEEGIKKYLNWYKYHHLNI